MNQILLILICLFSEAFFSGMETGVISIHRMRLRHFVRKGSPHARILQAFVVDFDRLLGTTLVGTNICLVIASVAAASLATQLIGAGGKLLASVVMTAIILVFCEYIPKAWFHARPLERCQRFAGLLRVAEIMFTPFSFAIIGLTRLLTGGTRKTFEKPDPFITREDLKLLAHEGEKDGVLSPRERVMIQRVIELSGKKAQDIMVPRERMVVVDADATVEQALAIARDARVTRVPVRDTKTNSFVGIVNVFYLLATGKSIASKPVRELSRPPLLISADMAADDVLPRMRGARHPLCLVVDKEQSVLGLITTEDVLSAIVGRLQR